MIKDKVALITGASSGIGFSTALLLTQNGVKVVAGARRMDKMDKLKESVEKFGGKIKITKLDVTKRDQCQKIAQDAIEEYGDIDILINNAGLMPLSFVKNLKIDEWDMMVDVNLKGVLYCTAAVIPHMINKKSGHIVNISSIAGRIVFPSGSVYCATKHAVTAFSEGLRQELSQRSNIKITCIEPGTVNTELTNTITDPALQNFVNSVKNSNNTMESLQSEDIAKSILYALDSPDQVNINEILIRPIKQER